MVSKVGSSLITPGPDASEMLLIVHKFMVSACRRQVYVDDCRQFEEIFCRIYAVFKRVQAKATRAEFGRFMVAFGKSFAAHAEVKHSLVSSKVVSASVSIHRDPDLKYFFQAQTERRIGNSNVKREVWFPIFAIRMGNFFKLAGIAQNAICISQLMKTKSTEDAIAAFDVVVVLSSSEKKVRGIWARILSCMCWIFEYQAKNSILWGFFLGWWLERVRLYSSPPPSSTP